MEQDRWDQVEIELMKRRQDNARARIAELALFGQVIEVEVIHDDIDDGPEIFEVPD